MCVLISLPIFFSPYDSCHWDVCMRFIYCLLVAGDYCGADKDQDNCTFTSWCYAGVCVWVL